MQIATLFCVLCLFCIQLYLVDRIRQFAKNESDILQNRKKEYEAEKGRNVATKEDIEGITRKVEEVKTSVSFSKQIEYEKKVEQERILIDLLHEATVISQSQNKLLLYFYDTSSRLRYDTLVESVNDSLTHFYHLCNMALVAIPLANIEEAIDDLSKAVSFLGSQVNVTATNAANLVDQLNKHYDHAMNNVDNEQSKTYWLTSSIQCKQQIEEMRGKAIPGKDELSEAIDRYCVWLKQLYGKDFFLLKS